MTSIGNDIIALRLINPDRTKQGKFYSKIICESELVLFNNNDFNALSFTNFVWLAWSIKESVYKFYKRNNHQATFSPTKIIIQKITEPVKQKTLAFSNSTHENISFNAEEYYCCEVNFDSVIFYTRSLISDELIFAVANNLNHFGNIYWGIKNIDDASYEKQSKTIRQFALNKLDQLYSGNNLCIDKSETGYPFLKEKKQIPLSFSHHGNFVGYAFAASSQPFSTAE